MKRKSYYICLFILLLFGAAGCSNKSETKPKDVKKKGEVVKVLVLRLNHLENENAVVFAESKNIRIFSEAIKTAVK